MCQISVYLDDEKIMEDVMFVEMLTEGVQLVKLFEPPHMVPAVIRQIDLMENKLILETVEQKEKHEGNG